MRAIEFSAYGDADVLRMATAGIPAVERNGVRIRVAAAAVNPADWKWRAGMFRELVPLQLPHVLGYDVAGTIDAVGADVTSFRIGDCVVGILDPVTKGGYAEFALSRSDATAAMPAAIDFATAAAVPTAGLTGVQIIEDHIAPLRGQSVLITGATGAVGRFALFAALRLGARVIAAVRSSQQEQARRLGAHGVVALGEQEWTGAPFDHVADTVGGPAVASLCRHLAQGGRIRTAATTPIDPQGLPSEPQFVAIRRDGKRLTQLLADVAAGLIDVPIARRLPLAAAIAAHRLVEAGGLGGKVILEP
jgi:NADPH:quinone reductase-like Zn-dependent oxidoreductase